MYFVTLSTISWNAIFLSIHSWIFKATKVSPEAADLVSKTWINLSPFSSTIVFAKHALEYVALNFPDKVTQKTSFASSNLSIKSLGDGAAVFIELAFLIASIYLSTSKFSSSK